MHPKDRAQMMAYLTRPAMARGGRIGFDNGGIANELKKFVEKFQIKNNRIPTQNEIVKAQAVLLKQLNLIWLKAQIMQNL